MSEALNITCPECSGKIGVPADFIGKLKCPQCEILVYSKDADTGVTWTTSQAGRATNRANSGEQNAESKTEKSRPKPEPLNLDASMQKTIRGRCSCGWAWSVDSTSSIKMLSCSRCGGAIDVASQRGGANENKVDAEITQASTAKHFYANAIPSKVNEHKIGTATAVCLILGVLGAFSSIVVTVDGGGSLEGFIVTAILNPLIWAGCYGVFRVYQSS